MLKGILGDPFTTIVGTVVLVLTLALAFGKLNASTWMELVGFIAGLRWVLENKMSR